MFSNINDLYRKIIIGLILIVVILVSLLGVYAFSYAQIPREIRVNIAPDLSKTSTFNAAQRATAEGVYAFVAYWIPVLYTWLDDGAVDYRKNAQHLRGLFSQRFRIWLNADYKKRGSSLNNKVRSSSPLRIPINRISQYAILDANGDWRVTLPMQVTEYFGSQSVPIIDETITYTFRVILSDLPLTINPWGLEIDAIEKITRSSRTTK